MVDTLVAIEALLELPLAVALAVSLAYRLMKRKWWRLPLGVFGAIGISSLASALLGYWAFRIGQSSASDDVIGSWLTIGAVFGFAGISAIQRLARRNGTPHYEEPAENAEK